MKARKKDTPAGGRKNYFLETLLFLAVMVLTLRFCFSGQKPQEIWAAVKSMRGMSPVSYTLQDVYKRQASS